jgi:hypothetical protein
MEMGITMAMGMALAEGSQPVLPLLPLRIINQRNRYALMYDPRNLRMGRGSYLLYWQEE